MRLAVLHLFAGSRSRTLLVAGIFAAAGVAALIVAVVSQHHAPRPPAAAATGPLGPTAPTTRVAAASTGVKTGPSGGPTSHPATRKPARARPLLAPAGYLSPLPTSVPLRLTIPAIGVTTDLLHLGLNQDGTVQVPPLSDVGQAGWYQFSATPGSAGSAVILGHVDSATYGQGVFFDLGTLRPGDEADITRADGSTAVFRIDRVAEYPKTDFPSHLVYGPTNYASLKLVTCGGRFDSNTGNYLDNIVAFGTLTSHR